ncbi:MAG: ABC transporter permease [Saprospiraceae bacterium]|nr:ABC transporter permease [Saprospiraceae bacterium]
MFIRWFIEGIGQAFVQLKANKLRTFLSLLGITIGIFCIIAVRSAVTSLEDNIRTSFEKLGKDVLYISKMPWAENPHENYWKYFKRPNPDIVDLEAILKRSDQTSMAALSVFVGSRTIKHQSSHLEDVMLIGVTHDYTSILNIEIANGRWLTRFEYDKGKNNILMGHVIARDLFPNIDPVGREVKISGQRFRVIGVIAESGDDLINPVNFDEAILMGYPTAKKIANVRSNRLFGTSLMVKAAEGVEIDDLRGEVTGILRSVHRLRPREDDDFAINELSILSNLLDRFFGVVNLAGVAIGLFAILVGMFSVANIMFVSVKERTSLIGIKMALGAKRRMILWEFLVEATCICLVGGLLGLLLVYFTMLGLSATVDFRLTLSFENLAIGLLLSIAIGIISGIWPALIASRMDPVEAMRK